MKRWPNVTAKYVDFLFNREETVVSIISEPELARIYGAYVARTEELKRFAAMFPADDTELQLPPSDESKVGDDV